MRSVLFSIIFRQSEREREREKDSKKRLFDLTSTLKSGPVTTRRYRKNKYKFRPRSISENCVIMIFF